MVQRNRDAIREMADEGMAVLMTTHLLEEADKADGVVIMSHGKVIAHGAPQQLRAAMGEGIITIVIGISFMDFPQKHRLVDHLVRHPRVMRLLNWIRTKEKKPPFEF